MDTVFFFNSSAAKDWHHLLLALTLVLTDAVFSFLAPTLSVYYIQYLPGTAYHSIDIPHITLWTDNSPPLQRVFRAFFSAKHALEGKKRNEKW